MGLIGYAHLSSVTHSHAERRAIVIAKTLAARLEALPREDRALAVRSAAKRGGAEYVFLDPRANVVVDAPLGTPTAEALGAMITAKTGEVDRKLGTSYFATEALSSHETLMVFVGKPAGPRRLGEVLGSLAALSLLLLSAAAFVAFILAKEVTREVDFVTLRVRQMADTRIEPTGEHVPIRAVDEVAVLTSAFNELVDRFTIAEKAYHHDLERARSVDRERAAFLAAVSHELRSPLNAILGFADVLLSDVDGKLTTNSREEVEQIKGSGERLLELINDILEFSALESGQLRLKRAMTDLREVAESTVKELSVTIRDRNVQLRLDAPEPVASYVDGKRIRQVLTNLVSNALKFTQEGFVTVSVHADDKRVVLAVHDTGPGIRPEDQGRIFLEYQQGGAEVRNKRGTGLGLAIARRLVELHGGRISVVSEPDKGSIFTIELPLRDKPVPVDTSPFGVSSFSLTPDGVRR
jgi:signal transduction histidine kinase